MTLEHLLVILLVGLVAGFLASHLVSGHGYGVVGDIVVGVLGALLSYLVLATFITNVILVPLGIAAASLLGEIIIAFIGAVILLAVLRLVARSTHPRGRYRRYAPRYYQRRRWL